LGNLHDLHDSKTLANALDAVAYWTSQRYARVLVDQDYHSHEMCREFIGDHARQESACQCLCASQTQDPVETEEQRKKQPQVI
jgi:hypothetical protein